MLLTLEVLSSGSQREEEGLWMLNLVVLQRTKITIYVWLSSEVLADLIITGVLLACLLKSKTGWGGTDTLINRLIKYV